MGDVPCWLTRWEAAGYDEWLPWSDDHPELFECDHPAHLAACEAGCDGWDCPASVCRWDNAHKMCELDKGHDGEHRFVNESEIVLVFR